MITQPHRSEHCYVSVGFPGKKTGKIIYEKVLVTVKADETAVQAAKRFRKNVADEISKRPRNSKKPKYNPSQLFYIIYLAVQSPLPFDYSANTPAKLIQ